MFGVDEALEGISTSLDLRSFLHLVLNNRTKCVASLNLLNGGP